jgi:hypothetical protein
MAKPWEPHQQIEVETYVAEKTGGLHGERHMRPLPNQGYSTAMNVRSPKHLRYDYDIGTKFRIWAKLTDREGGKEFLSTFHGWPYEVIETPKIRLK